MKKYIALPLIMISSCNISNRSYSDAAKWVPSDFDPSKSTLLVEHYPGKEKSNKSMKNFIDKKYPGKYEIVNKEDILAINGKYTDTKFYKYAVLWGTIGGTSYTSFTGGGTTTNFSLQKLTIAGIFWTGLPEEIPGY
jgi:hypothetical protein